MAKGHVGTLSAELVSVLLDINNSIKISRVMRGGQWVVG